MNTLCGRRAGVAGTDAMAVATGVGACIAGRVPTNAITATAAAMAPPPAQRRMRTPYLPGEACCDTAQHDTIGETGIDRHERGLAPDHRAGQLVARPALRQLRVGIQAAQQEAHLVLGQFAVHQGGELFAQCLAHDSLTFASDNSGRSF